MPNWKKLITSGSDAALNSLNVTSALTASGLIYPTSDGINGQVISTDGNGNLTFSSVSGGGTALIISGSSALGTQVSSNSFTKLQFDSDTGINLDSIDSGATALISIGAHYKDIIVDGQVTLVATGSDQLELISGTGINITTSTTDTNSNSVSKELAFSVDGTIATTGSNSFVGDQDITGALTASSAQIANINYPTSDGTDGQALITDGAGGLTFGFPTNADDAEKVTFEVQNGSDVTLPKGTPIHISSSVGSNSIVIAASASDASTMPAHGILNQQLTAGSDGVATIIGQITGVNTSTFSAGDTLYVAADGGYTNVKPQGSGNLIQNLGIVKKVDASNGTGEVYGSGRSNDVPNLPVGKVWVGSSTYSVTSSVVHLDESNGRLGIGTDTPTKELTVVGSISSSLDLLVDGEIRTDIVKGRTYSSTNYLSLEDDFVSNQNGVSLFSVSSTVFGIDANNNSTTDSFKWVTDGANPSVGTELMTLTDEGDLSITGNVTASANVSITGDLVVAGTGSFNYIQSVTGSAKIIGDAYIILNNNTPVERFAGIVVQDSGSAGVTASLEFDGQTNDWFYEYSDDGGVTTDHGVVMFGPEYNTKGSPTYNTANTVLKSNGDHHLEDSNITDNGNTITLDSTLYVTESKVGIGTTSPQTPLHVEGLVRITESGNTAFYSGDYVRLFNSQAFDFKNSSGSAISRINLNGSSFFNGGNVGIGTASPASKLHVSGSTRLQQNGQTLDLVGTDHTYIGFYPDGTSAGRKAYIGFPGASIDRLTISNEFNDDISFLTNGSEKVTIQNDGNVGIGTTSPGAKLQVEDVNAGGVLDALLLTNKSTTAGTSTKLKFVNSTDAASASNTNYINSVRNAASDNDLIFGTSNSDRMTIDSGGNVGIGTTSPQQKLQVASPSDTSVVLGASYLSTNNNNFFEVGINANDGYLNLKNSGVSTTVHIDSDGDSYFNGGNVGIGTTSPTKKLHVAGEISGSDIFINNWGSVSASLAAIQEAGGVNGSGTTSYIPKWLDSDTLTDSIAFDDGSRFVIEGDISGSGDLYLGSTTNQIHVGSTEETNGNGKLKLYTDNSYNATVTSYQYDSNLDLKAGVSGSSYVNNWARIRLKDNNNGNGHIGFWVSGSEYARIDNSGNIGIGTTSPGDKLHVDGQIRVNNGITFTGTGYLNNNVENLQIQTVGLKDIYLSPAANRNVIIDSGNVGIGTTSPSAKLDSISPDGNTNSLRLGRADNSNYWDFNHAGNDLRIFNTAGSESDVLIGVNSSGVDQGNKVGIGTSIPTKKLHVAGEISGSDIFINNWGSVSASLSTHESNISALNSVTGSYLLNTTDTLTGNLTVTGTITAKEFHTEFVSASIIYESGSTKFGDTSDDNHDFTGSVGIDGDVRLKNSGKIYLWKDNSSNYIDYNNWISSTGATQTIQNTGAGGITFKTLSDARMFISSSGDVGIGTTSPAFKTTIYSDSSTDSFPLVVGQPNSVNEFVGIGLSGFVASNGAVKAGFVLDRKNTYGVGDIHILNNTTTDNSNATLADSRLTILQNGNVGIGTTSPSQKLEVSGALVVGMTTPAPFWNALFKDYSDGSGVYISSINGGGGKYIAGNAYYYNSTLWRSDKTVASAINLDNGSVVFYTNSGLTANTDFTPTERLRITSSGNVGIGTTSPGAKLDIAGDLRVLSSSISYQENTDVDTGTETVATIAHASYDAAFFDYVIKNGTNLRAGTVIAIHDGTNVEFTDNSTKDIGDTSGVTFSVDISSTDLRLRATTTSDNWVIKSLVRSI